MFSFSPQNYVYYSITFSQAIHHGYSSICYTSQRIIDHQRFALQKVQHVGGLASSHNVPHFYHMILPSIDRSIYVYRRALTIFATKCSTRPSLISNLSPVFSSLLHNTIISTHTIFDTRLNTFFSAKYSTRYTKFHNKQHSVDSLLPPRCHQKNNKLCSHQRQPQQQKILKNNKHHQPHPQHQHPQRMQRMQRNNKHHQPHHLHLLQRLQRTLRSKHHHHHQ